VGDTGTCTVDDDTAISLTGTADTGSTFAGWSGGTGSASGCSGTGNCSFNITEDSGVTGTFTLNQYTVTPSAGPNGSISPSVAVQVNYGSPVSFTIKPNARYHVTTPVGGTCGGSYTGDPFDPMNGITYTTGAVTAACTVSAAFAANDTTTVITSHTPDPSTFGQVVTFTATVTGGAGTPTGTVTFSEGATTYCSSVPLNGSQAACSTSSLSTGSHTITATYSGDGNYNGSSGTVGQTVNKATPAVNVIGGTFPYDGNPHPATATATGVGGANVSGSFTFTYTPGGSSAPVNAGNYSVSVSFTSTDPNYTNATGTGYITITVKTPIQLLQDLINNVNRLEIPKGTKQSLTSKLNNAVSSSEKGNENAAINQINAFINEVNAQRGKKIPTTQADELIRQARSIIDVINL